MIPNDEEKPTMNRNPFHGTFDDVPEVVQIYLNELLKIPVMTSEDTLKKLKERKDPHVFDELVKGHLRLVIFVALKYRRFNDHDFMDLVQEGNQGLITGLKKFNLSLYDQTKPISFSTYLINWIRSYMKNILREQDRLEVEFEESHFEIPNQQDITEKIIHKNLVEKSLSCINPQESEIISRHFGIGKKRDQGLDEISKVMGLSIEWTRLIEQSGLEKLRKIMMVMEN